MTGTHCKNQAHLNVGTVPASPADAGPGTTTAEHLDACECANNPSYTGACVVISHDKTDPDVGMHVYPDAAAWLAGELRDRAASNPNDGIVLAHTFDHQWRPYRTFTPAGATDLASRIEAALS